MSVWSTAFGEKGFGSIAELFYAKTLGYNHTLFFPIKKRIKRGAIGGKTSKTIFLQKKNAVAVARCLLWLGRASHPSCAPD